MSEAKRQRCSNFSEHEKESLTEILSFHPIIESKLKTAEVEDKKKSAWEKIANEFNCRPGMSELRKVEHLQVCFYNY